MPEELRRSSNHQTAWPLEIRTTNQAWTWVVLHAIVSGHDDASAVRLAVGGASAAGAQPGSTDTGADSVARCGGVRRRQAKAAARGVGRAGGEGQTAHDARQRRRFAEVHQPLDSDDQPVPAAARL